MKVSIQYTGQIASLLGMSQEWVEVGLGTTLGSVVDGILARHGEAIQPFFRDADGGLPATLLVACNGEQADGDRAGRDVSEVRELVFMSPIAGG